MGIKTQFDIDRRDAVKRDQRHTAWILAVFIWGLLLSPLLSYNE